MKISWEKGGRIVLLLILASLLVIAGCSQAADSDNTQANQPPAQTEGSQEADHAGESGTQDDTAAGANNGQAVEPAEEDLSPVPDEPEQTVTKTVTLFFADDDLMNMYRVEREIEAEREEDLPKKALEAWMEGPKQEGLTNLVPPETVVEKVDIRDGVAYVSFSKEIRNANLGSGGEMFLIDQIILIMEQFGADATQILVEGQVEESILGHVTTNEPISAPDPERYPWYEE